MARPILRSQLRNWAAAYTVCAWRGLARGGAGVLLRAVKGGADAADWAEDSNDFVVFVLKASLFLIWFLFTLLYM